MRAMIWPILLICVIAGAASGQQPQAPVTVGVVKAERIAITRKLTFVGRVEAVNRVEVRARVTGYLDEVLFKEGVLVKAGTPLYRIEHGLFEAAVEQAQGALERSKASRALTQIQLQRAQDLMDRQAGTVVARDQAKAADEQALGTIRTRPTSPPPRSTSATPTSPRRSTARSAGPTSPGATWSAPARAC